MNRRWWFSTVRMTVYVETNKLDIVVRSAPITRKFLGQHVKNLVGWFRKQPGFIYHEYK